jgi:hypothetical protein
MTRICAKQNRESSPNTFDEMAAASLTQRKRQALECASSESKENRIAGSAVSLI